jgi:hypothetical protein
MRRIALCLLHHPVVGRGGEVLTTSVTNLDVHDLGRCARAYGLEALYVASPLSSQRLLCERIVAHWVDGAGGRRIPDRKSALATVRVVADLDEARRDLGGAQTWTTAAEPRGGAVTSFADARRSLHEDGDPVLLVFGTGWGLAPSILEAADVRLEPVRAARDTGFNHLSVRAACAIVLDRLLGQIGDRSAR